MKIPRGFGQFNASPSLADTTQSATQDQQRVEGNWQDTLQAVNRSSSVWQQMADNKLRETAQENAKKASVDAAIAASQFGAAGDQALTDMSARNPDGVYTPETLAAGEKILRDASAGIPIPAGQEKLREALIQEQVAKLKAHGAAQAAQATIRQRADAVDAIVGDALRKGDSAAMRAVTTGPMGGELNESQRNALILEAEKVDVLAPVRALTAQGDLAGARKAADAILASGDLPPDRANAYHATAVEMVNRQDAASREIETKAFYDYQYSIMTGEVDPTTGQPISAADIQADYETGVFGTGPEAAAKRNQLTSAVITRDNKANVEQAKIAKVDTVVAQKSKLGINVSSSELRLAADARLGNFADYAKWDKVQRAYFYDMVKANAAPPQVGDLFTAGFTNEDLATTEAAHLMWRDLKVNMPNALNSVDADMRSFYEYLDSRMSVGQPFAKAVAAASAPVTPGVQDLFRKQYKLDPATTIAKQQEWFMDKVQTDLTMVGADGDAVVNAGLLVVFDDLVRGYYERRGGDLTAARDAAYGDMRRAVQPTTVNGYPELMLGAPEWRASKDMVTPLDSGYFALAITKAAAPYYDKTKQTPFIVPVPGVTSPSGAPAYQVMVRGKDDPPGSLGEPLLDDKGMPVPWFPDYLGYDEAKTAELKAQKAAYAAEDVQAAELQAQIDSGKLLPSREQRVIVDRANARKRAIAVRPFMEGTARALESGWTAAGARATLPLPGP